MITIVLSVAMTIAVLRRMMLPAKRIMRMMPVIKLMMTTTMKQVFTERWNGEGADDDDEDVTPRS